MNIFGSTIDYPGEGNRIKPSIAHWTEQNNDLLILLLLRVVRKEESSASIVRPQPVRWKRAREEPLYVFSLTPCAVEQLMCWWFVGRRRMARRRLGRSLVWIGCRMSMTSASTAAAAAARPVVCVSY